MFADFAVDIVWPCLILYECTRLVSCVLR